MHWKTKAALFRLFDAMPMGRKAYSIAQQRVTKSLPRPLRSFPKYIAQFDEHVHAFERHGAALATSSYLEFGAGWDLFYPLAFARAGMARQYLYDLNRYADPRFINHVIRAFRDQLSERFCRDIPEIASLAGLQSFGIDYRAPADARATGLSDDSIDLVSTTSVLEHIPGADIALIMGEMQRVCKPGALLSMIIDYEDHYGQRGGDTSVYNFLRFSETDWRKFNPDLHYQNRLRHSDYIEIFERVGLEAIEIETDFPEDWEAILPTDDLAREFSYYAVDDLKITRGRFLLRA